MNKKRLISALLVCCASVLSAKADLTGDINYPTSVGIGDSLTITGATIQNSVGDYSGGIYNLGSVTVSDGILGPDGSTVSGQTSFINNSTNQSWAGGGAIYSYASTINSSVSVTIGDYTSFEGNHTLQQSGCMEGSGGAIYIASNPGTSESTLTIHDNVNFSENYTNDSIHAFGGAMYIQNTETSIGDKLNISGNTADKSGGGIAINNNGGDSAKIGIDATFTDNTSKNGDGGAISSEDTNFTIGSGATFKGNEAVNGGAISISATDATKTFTIGTDSDTAETGAEFLNNKASGNGGAVYNTGKVEIKGGTFTGNSAQQGGALYNANNATASLTNVTVNAADSNGTNDIVNAGTVTTAGKNIFASNIRNDKDWHFTGENDVSGDMSGNGNATNAGIVNLSGDNSEYTGTYSHKDANAVTNVSGTFFEGESTIEQGTLNWNTTNNIQNGTLKVSGTANLNIGTIDPTGQGQDINGKLELNKGSSIADTVTTTINKGSSLKINGGEAALNTGDTWLGKVELESGTLNLDSITCGILEATNGKLNISGGNVEINENVSIDAPVELITETGSNMDIVNGGVITLDNGDTVGGKVSLNGGILNYWISDTAKSTDIEANTGYLNLLNGSNYVIGTGSTFDDDVIVDIQKGATAIAKTGTTFNLDGGNENQNLNDKWNGTIDNQGGTVTVTSIVNGETSGLLQSGGTTNILESSEIHLDHNTSKIEGGSLNVTGNSILAATDSSVFKGGKLNIDSTSKFLSNSENIGGAQLETLNTSGHFGAMNLGIDDYNITNLKLGQNAAGSADTDADFTIDVYGRSNASDEHGNDRFIGTNFTGDGTLNLSDWNLGGDLFGWDAPIDRDINLDSVFKFDNVDPTINLSVTRKEVFTPIGWYQLNNTGGMNGNWSLNLTRFNPQVYRGQVTTLAQWMNQLAIDDMLFNHSMLLPSFKDEDGGYAYSGTMANRYASTMPQYAPYQYSRKDGGLWMKMYGTFETLQMSQGLSNVGNNAYGTLIGADFGLKELKNGWKFMPTAYIGYNGAHQYYSGLGAYQNGGQAGFLGTWYKNNFILGGLIYGGVYQNSMDIAGHTDNTFNYFAGAATKAAYNWRFHRDWVLQPNLLLAYNFFGQQNWHSDFGQMGMMSGILNGINLAPGLNLIWEKETFSIYATLQYMYNVNGAVGGRAGNVSLPHLDMDRGYIQYGIGFTKRFTDRFAGYFQTVFRNVGRTGVGFQLGFNWMIGK